MISLGEDAFADKFRGEPSLTLNSLAGELRETKFCFVPNAGNAGDALIAVGTFHFFERERVPLKIISKNELAQLAEFDLVLFGGGGNLVPYYKDGFNFIRNAARLKKQIIILPHTTFGYEDFFLEIAENVRIFVREQESFNRLRGAGFPTERIGLEDDLALSISLDFFASIKREPTRQIAHCLRTDRESGGSFSRLPDDNVDIAGTWAGDLWHSRQFAESVSRSIAAYLVQFEEVVTDRLHVAILGALLGLRVRLVSNSYYKNRAVFLRSLRKRFPNVDFVEAKPFWIATPLKPRAKFMGPLHSRGIWPFSRKN